MKQDIIDMATQVYGKCEWHESALLHLEALVKLAAAKEREECAKVCDSTIEQTYISGYTGAVHSGRRECAAAIRARGQA